MFLIREKGYSFCDPLINCKFFLRFFGRTLKTVHLQILAASVHYNGGTYVGYFLTDQNFYLCVYIPIMVKAIAGAMRSRLPRIVLDFRS